MINKVIIISFVVVLSLFGQKRNELRIINNQTKIWNGTNWVIVGGSTGSGSTDTTSLSNRINKKQNTIPNIADTSKYVEVSDTTSRWAPKGTYQAPIANIADTSKYLKKSDTTTVFNQLFGGWTEIQRDVDTTLNVANITFTPLGQLHFTMIAGGVYEIQSRIFYNRATAANGVTIALNAGGSPTNIGITAEAADNSTDGTDMFKTARITTATDSIQLINTTVTTTEFIDIRGVITCDGSNRLFGFRWHMEVASSAITIKRGSYLRYRRLY